MCNGTNISCRICKYGGNIYSKTNSLDETLNFLIGCSFGKPQIQIEWDDFNSDVKNKLGSIFSPLVKSIGLENFKQIISSYDIPPNAKSSGLSNNQKIVKLFKFLVDKNFFN
jgi:hypothetical protein